MGGMVSDITLLFQCAEFTLSHSRYVEQAAVEELRTSAATPPIIALRLVRLQRAVLALGMFSLFESMLQTRMGWDIPLDQLDAYLKKHGTAGFAQKFNDYKLAINVLKHGKGRSYDELLARSTGLDFTVKSDGEYFFDEGDVSEILSLLIDVDEKFVFTCASLIEDAATLIRSIEKNWN